MKYTTTSLLMTALLAASGFAAAQNPTTPATRADVKSEVVRPGAGTPPPNLSEPPKTTGNTSGTTRAEVKSDVPRPDAATPPKNLSEPPKAGTASNTTRADVKAGVDRTDRELSTGEKAAGSKPSASAAKRKAMREERRAMKKSKRDMQMKDSTSGMPAADKTMNK